MSAYSIIPPRATTYRAGMVNVQLGSPLKAARSMQQPSSTARSSSETFQRTPKACATFPPASTRLANESPLHLCVSRLLSGVCCETPTSEAPRLRMSREAASIARRSMLQ
jgi:hypothetical protein